MQSLMENVIHGYSCRNTVFSVPVTRFKKLHVNITNQRRITNHMLIKNETVTIKMKWLLHCDRWLI